MVIGGGGSVGKTLRRLALRDRQQKNAAALGDDGKVSPASQGRAARIALGIEIWNFDNRVAVSGAIMRLLDRCC